MTSPERVAQIEQIRQFPATLAALVADLTDDQVTAVPIAGEWSIAQNVHHVVDSHMNSYIRCKLIATEENPPLKPYDEAAWATFPDAIGPDLTPSLTLLHALHQRWTTFWETLPDAAWRRTGIHEASGPVTLAEQLRLYVEHGNAHLAQVRRNLAAQSD